MPIRLILDPTPEEELRFYPKGDRPLRYLQKHRSLGLGKRPQPDGDEEVQDPGGPV